MESLFHKYLNTKWYYLIAINVAIYAIALTLEFQYIYTDQFYETYFKPQFGSEQAFLDAVAEDRSYNWINYLWAPTQAALSAFLISLCLFIGFNAFNYRLSLKKSIIISLQSIIVFSINYLLIILLKIINIIPYNLDTVDEIYFFQSLGYLLINQDYPTWIYNILSKINISEIIYTLFLALIINQTLKIKYLRSLLLVALIYGIGLISFQILSMFFLFIF